MKNFLKNFSLLGMLMLVVCVILGVGNVAFANGVATEIDTADPTKGTTVTHGTEGALETLDIRKWRPEMINDPVDQALVKIRPSVNQLDTILRYAGTMKTNNFEYEWYSIGTRELFDEADGAATINSNGDPMAVKGTVKIAGNVEKFDVTDTVLFSGVNGADGKPLIGYVYAKDEVAGTLSFTVLESQMTNTSGTYTIPAIADETKIYCLGRAAQELDVKTPAISYIPKPSKGYCQIFMCQIAESTYQSMMDKKVKFDISEVEEQALYEYRRRMEGSFLFGNGGKVYDPTKKSYVYLTNGIVHQITKSYTINTTNNANEELVALEKKIFTGNSGSNQRVMLAGSGFVEKLSKIQTVEKQLEAGNTEIVMGIKWNRIESNFGTLLLSHHSILDEYGWTNKAIVIDPQFLKKWQIANFERKQYDGKELAIMNGKFTVFSEVCGVSVYNPDAHAIVEAV